MEPSIFTKIITGEIPSHQVYETENVLAFMDIYPIQPGMVVVVPKRQIDNFEDLPQDLMMELMLASQKIMRALRVVFPAKKKIGLQIEGLEVPHVHVKLFPINTGEEFRAPSNTNDPDHGSLAALAAAIGKEITHE